ncbi:delta-lactam-biosynthetic de-N-acetylase [Clostridium peptidivorans]|uniref:delta-lactam-biosynthetic de-N-acetylase n=1 Tax=Clostridium peptidivorans TaxID=100174 RepID=UPI000BE2F7FA|nr:delta-lactam-biosynthetic de-N-acetylase [Clostridium peptidivorans]
MKKKCLSILVSIVLCFSLIGCKSNNQKVYTNPGASSVNEQASNSSDNKTDDAVISEEKDISEEKINTEENNSTNDGSDEKTSNDSVEKEEKPIKNKADEPSKNTTEESKAQLSTTTLETKERDWFFIPTKDGTPSTVDPNILNLITKQDGYYLGNTNEKVLYLTFDEGYENGYTGKILDILKANNVPAAFFVVTPYIKTSSDLVKRMVNEGHLVCNHSTNHPSMASTALKGKDKFNYELENTAKIFKDLTGKDMPKFFRPPMGKYSELSLSYTKELGYKTIFWSFAYHDWDINKQPSHEYAKKMIMDRTHNGSIMLLHAVSKTNTEILDDVIKELKAKGYRFASLDELK